MTTEKILMLGGAGSGKSSVLAAVYDQAVALTDGIDLSLTLDRESARPLLKKLHIIKTRCDQEIQGPFEITGIGDSDVSEYTVEVGRRLQDPILRLTFIDTKGGWLAEDPSKLQGLLAQCRAAILSVDAVELCEGAAHVPADPGICRNLPLHTRELLENWLKVRPASPRLLCIVPIKTETYLRQRGGFNETIGGQGLVKRIERDYKQAFASLQADRQWTAVVLTPVQTVGNLIFHSYAPGTNGDYPTERWQQIVGLETPYQRPTGYSPLDCDQPLRHILNFFLVQYINATNASRKKGFLEKLLEESAIAFGFEEAYRAIVDTFVDVFGQNRELVAAVMKFTEGVKRTSPFKVIQGNHLLSRNV
jgi:hypothetical protein